MKILIRTFDNVVIYAQSDLALDTEAHGDNWHDPNFHTGNATLAQASLPAGWMGAEWTYINSVWALINEAQFNARAAANLATVKATLSSQIDAAVIAIYDRPITLGEEYKAREKAAADYKAAGYTGTVPARLAGFAAPAGMTSTDAADLILEKAAQMRNALDLLSDSRMRKYEVQRATTEAEARTAYADVITEIAAVAASLI